MTKKANARGHDPQEADFSAIAPFYRWMEYGAFGNALQRRRTAFLKDVLDARSLLILGDGDGRFALQFLRAAGFSRAAPGRIDWIDSSSGMLRLAQERLKSAPLPRWEIHFQPSDIRSAQLCGPYDLVVSHFFLDCFSTTALEAWIPDVVRQIAADGKWLISEFAIPQPNPWRFLGRYLIAFLYRVFRLTAGLHVTSLPHYRETLQAHGLTPVRIETAWKGLVISELWAKSRRPE